MDTWDASKFAVWRIDEPLRRLSAFHHRAANRQAEIRAKLISPPDDRQSSQRELLAEAIGRGYEVSPDLFNHWVSIGLLDLGTAEGRGFRRGVRRTWSGHQRGLFLSLLEKHRQTRSLRALANVPVQVWLLWGEDYIQLRQVRRCLETWADLRRGRPSAYGHRPAAERLVRDLARPHADPRAKAALADALVAGSQLGELDTERVGALLSVVVGPRAPNAQTDGPRVLAILAAQWTARARFFEFTDGHFRWARALYLHAQAQYAHERAALAADPRFGKLHATFDLQHLANRACHDMLLNLGIALTIPPGPGLPAYLALEPWLEGRAHVSTAIDVERSALVVPPTVPNGRLGIGIRITIDAARTAEQVHRDD